MKDRRKPLKNGRTWRVPVLRCLVFCVAMASFIISNDARADLYRYESASGEVILTSQPQKGLKLIEVIRSDSSVSKKTAKSSKKTAKSASNAAGAQQSPSNSAVAQDASSPPPAVSAADDRAKLYEPYIAEAARIYNIPPSFIKAVIKIESNFNPRAVSRAGAMGLMQLMPATAEHMRVEDPFDPRQNIMGGTRYLRRLSDRYDGDINLVLSGYHAGPGNVEKAGGIPFEKTQQYVRNVYSWYVRYRDGENKNATK